MGNLNKQDETFYKYYLPKENETVAELCGEHWTVSAVSLGAFTDDIDTLTHTSQYHYFNKKVAEKIVGNIFFLEDELSGDAYVILADCPDFRKAELKIENGQVKINAGSDKIAVGSCRKGECEKLCRSMYRDMRGEKPLVSMSNTWGDRNGFSRVCEEFVLKEIDMAEKLGVDIVQIDDGWQMGSTEDTNRRDEKGRRVFADDFWVLNKERFPRGIKHLSDYAAKKGIKIGLWFAPDSHDNFATLERDVAILKNAYEIFGARFFKLDMYWIENDSERDRFLKLLREIYSLGDDVEVQLDVTRGSRINYLCGKEYGTVFVENRYTKWGNSFPHRTLRNLWMIGKYIPTSKFQFELVNTELNGGDYAFGDEFAPSCYDIDYLFAAVMVSNPLFWMEMQFLSEKSVEKLRGIMKVWKEHRDVFAVADIMPIGEKPCGRSHTGFYIKAGDEEYALTFREVSDESEGVFSIPTENAGARLLASNDEVSAELSEGKLTVSYSKKRAYALLKLEK